MIDSSVLVAGLVDGHEFNAIARPVLTSLGEQELLGIVLAETWSVLRRGPWNLDAAMVEAMLRPWTRQERMLPTPAGAYVNALRDGRRLNVGGNIHDLVIAYTCALAGLPLATLDRRQAAMAREIPGLSVSLLLPDRDNDGAEDA